MMDRFKNWYTTYHHEITWFLIGWCCLAGVRDLAEAHYASAVLSFGVAYLNYKLD